MRINAFELGENVVSRRRNVWLKRMARRTGGRHVGLDRPGVRVVSMPPMAEGKPKPMVPRPELESNVRGCLNW